MDCFNPIMRLPFCTMHWHFLHTSPKSFPIHVAFGGMGLGPQ